MGNLLVLGLSNGAIWALIAIGYTLVYGIIELINFAHGDNFMLGTFVAFALYGTLGLTLTTGPLGLIAGLLVCLIAAMAACAATNVMIERVAYRPLRNAPKLAPLITAVGLQLHPPERRDPVVRLLAVLDSRPDPARSTCSLDVRRA